MPEYAVKREVDIRLPSSTAGPGAGRTRDRIHVSDVLQYIGLGTGVLDAVEKFTPRSTRFRLALGLAWEDYIATVYPEIQYHPGEFEKDGIMGSPDGLEEAGPGHGWRKEGELLIDEFKLTWLSARWRLSERTNRIRMWQVLSYCALLEIREVNLWVGYLNGDYNREGPMVFAPDPVVYELSFTQKEVDANWRMVVNNVPPMLEEWKAKGWWTGSTEEWRPGRKGAGRVTQKKIDESDIFDLDLLEDAISA